MMKVKDLKVCIAKSVTKKLDMTLALTAANKSKHLRSFRQLPYGFCLIHRRYGKPQDVMEFEFSYLLSV